MLLDLRPVKHEVRFSSKRVQKFVTVEMVNGVPTLLRPQPDTMSFVAGIDFRNVAQPIMDTLWIGRSWTLVR
jgi:hypothetical protein